MNTWLRRAPEARACSPCVASLPCTRFTSRGRRYNRLQAAVFFSLLIDRCCNLYPGGASAQPRWEGGLGGVFRASGRGMKERRRCLSMVAVGDVAGVEYSLRTEDGSPFETRFDQVQNAGTAVVWFLGC